MPATLHRRADWTYRFLVYALAAFAALAAAAAFAVTVNDPGARRQLREANSTLDAQLGEMELTNHALDVILNALGRQADIDDADQSLERRLSAVPNRRRGAGWGRMLLSDTPGEEPDHPVVLRFRAFSRDATYLRLPITEIPEPGAEVFESYEATREWAVQAFHLFPDTAADAVSAGKTMTAWRNSFARHAAIDAWAVASAAQRAPDDAAAVAHALLSHLAGTRSLREDLRLLIHTSLETNLSISATNRILAAQLEAQSAAYLASGPPFVAGPSLAPPPSRMGDLIIR